MSKGHGAQFVAEQHHMVFQFTAIFICHRKQFPAEGSIIRPAIKFLLGSSSGRMEKNGGLSLAKDSGVDGAAEAEDLLQL